MEAAALGEQSLPSGGARSLPTAGRNRAATTAVGVPHNPEEEPEPQGEVINQIAAVLTEEEAAPGPINLEDAPILGDQLLTLDKEESSHNASGAGSVQDLQRQIEQVTRELQTRFDQQQERFRKRWGCDLSFEEHNIEQDFRDMTFNGQRKYMYMLAVAIMVYSVAAALFFNVSVLLDLEPPPNVTCFALRNPSSFANMTMSYDADEAPPSPYTEGSLRRWLQDALVCRSAAFLLLCAIIGILRFAPRRLALAAFVIGFWSLCFTFDMALANEAVWEDVTSGVLVPQPKEQLPSLLFIMLVYTAGIPGIPFTTASIAGWGVIATTLIQHFNTPATGYAQAVGFYDVRVLLAQLTRIILFNAFGTFIGIEQTRQMRLNFWHVRLLQEALQLHKLCRQRFHRLTANTLPAPIVKAIATGDTAFVKIYDNVTMLQADMVGFTPLSARFPPEKVLGILSDIFEEFDNLCEVNMVDKVKTIGDAYIVCAGALSDVERDDDAQRVVRMGLGMQEVVKRIATAEGIDVAVRIGVHTGRCTGGIIGTVRYHFDMWGGAVVGAVKMEETGEKGRVHISDSTHRLVAHFFETTDLGDTVDLGDTGKELNIRKTYLVGDERVPTPLPIRMAPANDEEDHGVGGHGRRPSRKSLQVANIHLSTVPLRAAHWVGKLGKLGKHAEQQEPGTPKRKDQSEGAAVRMTGTRERDSQDEDAIAAGADVDVDIESLQLGQRDRAASNFFVTAPSNADEYPSIRPSNADGGIGGGKRRGSTQKGGGGGGMLAGMMAMVSKERASGDQEAASNKPTPPRSSLAAGTHPAGRHGASVASDGTGISLNDRRTTLMNSGGGIEIADEPSSHEDLFGESNGDGEAMAPPGLIYAGSSYNRATMVSMRVEPGRASMVPPPPPGAAPPPADTQGSMPSITAIRNAAKQQKAAETQSMGVRILFHESVRAALRRSALATSVVLLCFGMYDWLVWGRYAVLSFYLMRFLVCVPAAAIPTMVLAMKRNLKGQHLPFINLLLLFLPWLSTEALVLMSPGRSRQYMLTLAYFQIWTGYTMLSLPTTILTCLQVFFSALYFFAEYSLLSFDMLGNIFRVHPPQTCEGIDSEISNATLVIYLLCAHVVGIMHNRRRRRNLRNHAKLLVTQEDRMARISLEVEKCDLLLKNVFPEKVLDRMKDSNAKHNADGTASAGSSFAEKFHDCTFLFAKIVGLKELTELGEKGERDPSKVVDALQLIFDRFDQLADTFKVQKVRKTVNEYYMVAAGLPDPEALPDQKERALAMVALAFSMVHVMDIINSDSVIRELGVTLHCQVGIHSGDAIAGVIGHKRFQYDLCGDAVNTAARMCSYSAPGCINVSPTTLQLVRGEYGALYRGERAVKGKGNMALYFLTGRLNPAMRELMDISESGPKLPLALASQIKRAAGAPSSSSSDSPGGVTRVLGAIGGAIGNISARLSVSGAPAPPPHGCSAIMEEPSGRNTRESEGTVDGEASVAAAAGAMTEACVGSLATHTPSGETHTPPGPQTIGSSMYLTAQASQVSTDEAFVKRCSVDTPDSRNSSARSLPLNTPGSQSGGLSRVSAAASAGSGSHRSLPPHLLHEESSGLRVDMSMRHDESTESVATIDHRTISMPVSVPFTVQRDNRPPPSHSSSESLSSGDGGASCGHSGRFPPSSMPACVEVGSSPRMTGVMPPPNIAPSPTLSVASAPGGDGRNSGASDGGRRSAGGRRSTQTSSSRGSGASSALGELRCDADPTVRSLNKMRSTSWARGAQNTLLSATSGLGALPVVGRLHRESVHRAREASLSRARQASTTQKQWDRNSLAQAAAAAALGGDVDIGLDTPLLDMASPPRGEAPSYKEVMKAHRESLTMGNSGSPSAFLRSLSVGHRPRYSCQSAGGGSLGGSQDTLSIVGESTGNLGEISSPPHELSSNTPPQQPPSGPPSPPSGGLAPSGSDRYSTAASIRTSTIRGASGIVMSENV